jgi:alkylated DNA repair dioxygenase AlkB
MQSELFQAPNARDSLHGDAHKTCHELGDASLVEYPHFLGIGEANSLVETLIEQIIWQQAEINIAGKLIPVPRLQCWMGDKKSRYGYSGIRLTPEPWHPLIVDIKNRVESVVADEFNSVLLNFYRDGNDSVAWHADDEKELGDEPIIASLSLGAVRTFELKHKRDRSLGKRKMELANGSLIIMEHGMQQHWQHCLPKALGLSAPRINLTFRKIVS